MRWIVMLLVLALAGCASVSGLRDKSPDVTITTAKAPAEYGQCVANGWGEFMGVSVNQSLTPGGGYTVSMPNAYTGNNGVMDVDYAGHVRVSYRLGNMGGYGKFTKVVKACK